jgi:6-phosphogluconolactonase
MPDRPRTIVSRDADALARAVAQAIADFSNEPRNSFSIALCGGSTPRRLYETMAAGPYRERTRWNRLELFFGDERPVAPEDPQSNYGMARRALLSHVAVRAHPMPAESGDAEAYERLLLERLPRRGAGAPVFDLVLLGIGSDGHTASLFPGTAALSERRRLVVMNEVPERQTRRMTITYPLINAARRVWILARGAGKREIVAKCMNAKAGDERRWPIVGVRPQEGELVWWLDEASAGSGAPAS